MQRTDEAMIDILAADGTIAVCDPRQDSALGHAPGTLAGRDWSAVYPLAARERLMAALSGRSFPVILSLELRTAAGGLVPFVALAERTEAPSGGVALRLYKWPSGGALQDLASLAEAHEVVSGILAASDDAGWCIEWADPVDLSAPEHEIIRQVFDNGPRWRFCNPAMARLYRAPDGVDFNAQPVSDTLPRTPENEEFIRTLIRADFDINGVPSRDKTYDGTFIEVENDVRGHIRGNRLIRMWGTVRDVSKYMRRAAMLGEEIAALESLLAAVPDAFVAVDRTGTILHANLAAEQIAGAEGLVHSGLGGMLALPVALPDLFAQTNASPFGRLRHPLHAHLAGGQRVEVMARAFRLRGNDCLAMTLRPAGEPFARGPVLEAIRGGRS